MFSLACKGNLIHAWWGNTQTLLQNLHQTRFLPFPNTNADVFFFPKYITMRDFKAQFPIL